MAANIGSISGGDKFWLASCGRASGLNSGGIYMDSSPPNSGYSYTKVIVIVTGYGPADSYFWNGSYGATMSLSNNYSGSVVNSEGMSYTWHDYSGKMATGMFSCTLRMIVSGNSSPWGFSVSYTRPTGLGSSATLGDLRYAYILQFSNSASW